MASASDAAARPISRRRFVAQGALAAAGVLAGCRSEHGAGERLRVIVAGAGLAGLVAAYELARRGHDVTVLEARDRPGGRVHTIRGAFDDGLHVEAGAVFVPDAHDLTVRYARELGVALVPSGGRARGHGARVHVRGRTVAPRAGEPVRWPLELSADEAGLSAAALRERYLGPVLDAIGDPRHPAWPGEAARGYDAVSLGELLRRRGASEAAVAAIRLGYLDEWGDGVDRCSALSLLRDLALLRGAREMSVIAGGSDHLPRAFAERLGTRIRYGAAVTAFEQDGRGVRVAYHHASEQRSMQADRVVCAIPFPILRSIRVSPPFSRGKQAAITGLRTTSVTRVYLQLRRRCWDADRTAVATDLPVMHLVDSTAGQPGTRAVLEAFITGPNARSVAAMPADARVAFAREQAERVHPGAWRAFERGASWAWDLERWSLGDYAWFAPGELGAFLPHLSTPEGRVHFAGDHTSAWPGWMQGALSSGLRAAREIDPSIETA